MADGSIQDSGAAARAAAAAAAGAGFSDTVKTSPMGAGGMVAPATAGKTLFGS